MQILTVLLTLLALAFFKISDFRFGLYLHFCKYSHHIIFDLIEHGREHFECFPFVLLLRVLLCVAAQPDSLAKVVHLGEMFFPLLVQRLQHHGFLEVAHHRFSDRSGLLFVSLCDLIRNLAAQCLFVKVVVGLQPLGHRQGDSKMRLKVLLQPGHIPLLFKTFRWNRPVNNFGSHLFSSQGDGSGDILRRH